jgi:A/G-specific adenine glycosylase
MDFGATICKPALPLCHHCILKKACVAYKEAKVNQLPFKEKVLLKKSRWFYYFLFEQDGKLLVHKREGKDIWQSLYEFYLLEANEQMHWDNALVSAWLWEQFDITRADVQHISPLQKQQLTHQQIKGQFIKVKLKSLPDSLKHYQWQTIDQLSKLAFPKFINQYLELKEMQVSLF